MIDNEDTSDFKDQVILMQSVFVLMFVVAVSILIITRLFQLPMFFNEIALTTVAFTFLVGALKR